MGKTSLDQVATWNNEDLDERKAADWVGSLQEAKDKCIGDHRCEVVCYHSKTGKAQYYQNFRKALGEVESGKKGWKEILQKAPPWQEDGWTCLQASPKCRRQAAEIAQKKREAGLKETMDALNELSLLKQSLHRLPPSPFQPQGSFSHDSADFLGKLKFPTGEEAQELRQECTNIASKVINAEEVSDLGSCSERIWVHRPIKASQGRWQECCASENGLKCMDRFVIPANSCESCQGVCLDIGGKEGYCLELGSPGSWEGSGGKVVELMFASVGDPTVQLVLGAPLLRRGRCGSFI
ncbi:PPM-type phosphatase domain-containing protein [Durusdinium trenchii]|uniref:PPM-type phosphatase domain-containing protein n=1 Tax=Durusdinium trenchii TaxID=1381693 RepID=A0ABP0MJN8_9DINO